MFITDIYHWISVKSVLEFNVKKPDNLRLIGLGKLLMASRISNAVSELDIPICEGKDFTINVCFAINLNIQIYTSSL